MIELVFWLLVITAALGLWWYHRSRKKKLLSGKGKYKGPWPKCRDCVYHVTDAVVSSHSNPQSSTSVGIPSWSRLSSGSGTT